jgi:hypothetical protein
MNENKQRPSPAQLERARRLLAHEGGTGSAKQSTAAPGRVFDKLHAQLAPLVGVAGVHMLLVRSAKLAGGELAQVAELPIVEGARKLRERLQGDPAVAAEAAALFGTFLTLLTTFIGERLTTQVLLNAWPSIEDTAPGDTKP